MALIVEMLLLLVSIEGGEIYRKSRERPFDSQRIKNDRNRLKGTTFEQSSFNVRKVLKISVRNSQCDIFLNIFGKLLTLLRKSLLILSRTLFEYATRNMKAIILTGITTSLPGQFLLS